MRVMGLELAQAVWNHLHSKFERSFVVESLAEDLLGVG
jgi:hypothetical protein